MQPSSRPAATGQPESHDLAPLPDTLPVVEERAAMPAGFRGGGLAAGIKPSGKPDLAVIAVTGGSAAVAATFTRNQVVAAPVRLSRAHLNATEASGAGKFGWADAIIATSGSANAATGQEGDADQAEVGRALAAALGTKPERTLAVSTGVIGVRLPVAKIKDGLARLIPILAPTDDALRAVAGAMMTTDTQIKLATTTLQLPGPDRTPVTVTVSGIAKGVGMIHPRMATMLSMILTDASVAPATLHALLAPIVQRTWNQISVDGDTSTNDTVYLVASGASKASVAPASDESLLLGRAIEAVARSLARQQAADGEGASTLITCQVSGGADDHDARAIARSVVSSSLLKAAIHGRDPNWGRVASGAGNARLPDEQCLEAAGLHHVEAAARAGRMPALDLDKLRIAIAGTLVFDGTPLPFDRAAVRQDMDAPEVLIRLHMGLGSGIGEAFGCDLTEQYVIENAEYTT
jgi:glutamate N-acetyltransferase/amino-acid N-acetyltransferase